MFIDSRSVWTELKYEFRDSHNTGILSALRNWDIRKPKAVTFSCLDALKEQSTPTGNPVRRFVLTLRSDIQSDRQRK